MPKKNKSIPHPDDFMIVSISLEFRAKLNPDLDDPPDLETIAHKRVLSATRAEEFLERILSAVRDRRLYGLMAAAAAESSVGAGEWIGAEISHDFMADIRTRPSRSGSPLESSEEDEPM